MSKLPIPTPRKLLRRLDAMAGVRIGVLGDFAADHYLVGTPSRVSREAPVLILKKREDTIRPGQAGNSAANLAALGVRCEAFGVVGDDPSGRALVEHLAGLGVDASGVIVSTRSRTLVKTRILAGAHHAALQQVIRLDDDEGLRIEPAARRRLRQLSCDAASRLDAFLVSDYGYGTVNQALWSALRPRRSKPGSGRRSVPLRVLDSRYAVNRFKGADVVTPNESEVLAQLKIRESAEIDPVDAGRKLMKSSRSRAMVMTRGNEGMIVFAGSEKPVRIPIHGSDEVTDVTGAGDTVAAVVTAALAAGASLVEAAHLANIAAGLAVMKQGAATVSRDEIRAALHKEATA